MAALPWFVPAITMVTISAAYFWLDAGQASRRVRLLVSAHGVIAATLYLAALLLWELTRAYRPWAAWPYLLLHLLPIASIIYSLVRFSGPKLLHLTQLANLACMVYTAFVGGMAITGDWL